MGIAPKETENIMQLFAVIRVFCGLLLKGRHWIIRFAHPSGRPEGRSTCYALLSGLRRNDGFA